MHKIQNILLVLLTTAIISPGHAWSDSRIGAHRIQLQNTKPGPVIYAQFTIELGNSSGSVRDLLESQGYTEVQITQSSFTTVRAQACFQGSRYLIKVKTIGARISRLAKIGECRPVFSSNEIINKLSSGGYTRISLEVADSDIYVVRACRDNKRMRLKINRYGKIVERTRKGNCREFLDIAEVRQHLRKRDFNRIKLVREEPRQYTFEACTGRARVNLQIRKDGTVRRERRIGNCTLPIELWQLRSIVERNGYNRVVVVDQNLPAYGVEACRGTRLVHLNVNKYGELRNEKRIGNCEPALSRNSLDAQLRDRGENRILIEVLGNDGFVVESCDRKRKYRTEFDLYGTVLDRRKIGVCGPPPRLTQLINQFEKQKISEPNLYVEGCRNGRIYRYRVNIYGEIRNTKRLGKC